MAEAAAARVAIDCGSPHTEQGRVVRSSDEVVIGEGVRGW